MGKTTYYLDAKDRKILYELDSDCRQPASRIAKKLKTSPEVINYRIKKLEQDNIITHYQVMVNFLGLGVIQFKMWLSLQHIGSAKLDELIEELKKNHAVKWIVSTKGSWDLVMAMEVQTLEEVDRVKEHVLSLFSGFIDRKALSILVEAETYSRDYISYDKNITGRKRMVMKYIPSLEIDDIDYRILKELVKNGKCSVVDIARNIKTTPRIINYHLKQMIKRRVIEGTKVALNYEKLGINFYKTLISVDNPKKERVAALISYLKAHKNVIHHVKVLGNWDLEPEFETFSENEFDDILTDMKDRFLDIIKTVDIITIKKEYKFIYF